MRNEDLVEKLEYIFMDKRDTNTHIPPYIILILSIATKMKLKTSLTDVLFAVTDEELLSVLGWNI